MGKGSVKMGSTTVISFILSSLSASLEDLLVIKFFPESKFARKKPRVVISRYSISHCFQLLKRAKLLTLANRCLQHICILMYKIKIDYVLMVSATFLAIKFLHTT